jgi:predicted CXXCH cytochrome family protein
MPSVPTVLPPLGRGEIRGRVFLSGNKVLRERVRVRESGAGVSAESGPDGVYRLMGLSAGKAYLVAEGNIGGRRHLAVDVAILGETEGGTVDLQLRDASNVDTFCSDCHPYRGEATRRDQIIRDLHKSDIKPVRATEGPEMLDERGHVTCESCHTVHEKTEVEFFLRQTFRNGALCIRCHR